MRIMTAIRALLSRHRVTQFYETQLERERARTEEAERHALRAEQENAATLCELYRAQMRIAELERS